MEPSISDPHRVYAIWAWAPAERSRQDFERHRRWRTEVDAELVAKGVAGRVKAAREAVATEAFVDAFVAAREERARAKDEGDLVAIAGLVLRDLGVDMADVVLKFRRVSRTKATFGVGTTIERAREAIAAATARGYPPPDERSVAGFSAAAPDAGAQQEGQGTIPG